MPDIAAGFALALDLIVSLDAELAEIVGRSLTVSLAAVLIASVVGLPLGAIIAVYRFPGRRPVIVLLNALWGGGTQLRGVSPSHVLSRSFGVLMIGYGSLLS